MTDKPTTSVTEALKITRVAPPVKPKAKPGVREKKTDLGAGMTQVTYS